MADRKIVINGMLFDRMFAYAFLLLILLGPIPTMLAWLAGNLDYIAAIKYIYYPTIALIVVRLLLAKFIVKDWFVIFVVLYGGFLIIYGVVVNGISRPTFAHLQAILLPIIGLSFGYYLCKNKSVYFRVFEKNMLLHGVFATLIIGIYYWFVSSGAIPYFGVSTLIAIPTLYALSLKKFKLAGLFFVASIFTGKRVVILGIIIVALLIVARYSVRRPLAALIILTLSVASTPLLLYAVENMEIFRRLSPFIQSSDGIDWDVVTSGRLTDFMGAVSSLNADPHAWIFGKGVGATFEFGVLQDGQPRLVHYAHFSPISYVFLGGFILAVPVYVKVLSLLLFSYRHISDFYCMVFAYYFFASFSGAILFSDPFLWTVAGIVLSKQRSYFLAKHTHKSQVGSFLAHAFLRPTKG